jgi:hypothetical protein
MNLSVFKVILLIELREEGDYEIQEIQRFLNFDGSVGFRISGVGSNPAF